MTDAPLLETRGLTKHFKVGGNLSRKTLHAVDDADLVINRKEIVALVGESGSGKSTIARLLARVYEPTSGEILYQGRPLAAHAHPRGRAWPTAATCRWCSRTRSARSTRPTASRTASCAGSSCTGPSSAAPQRAGRGRAGGRGGRAAPRPREILDRYPYELSGGQRQRIGFAQALAYRPKLILADEPVSMLDVSIRIGLLNLMAKLREDEGVSFLYITHDIASARYVSDRLLVMYAGHIVESGPTEDVLADPKHPYTQLLLSAVPDPRAPLDVGAESDTRRAAAGDRPDAGLPVPLALPAGHRRVRDRRPRPAPCSAPATRRPAMSRPPTSLETRCMKIAVVGGGSTYTPELIEGFARRADVLAVDELVLHDIAADRLDVVGGLARRILAKQGYRGRL